MKKNFPVRYDLVHTDAGQTVGMDGPQSHTPRNFPLVDLPMEVTDHCSQPNGQMTKWPNDRTIPANSFSFTRYVTWGGGGGGCCILGVLIEIYF